MDKLLDINYNTEDVLVEFSEECRLNLYQNIVLGDVLTYSLKGYLTHLLKKVIGYIDLFAFLSK